MICAFYVICSIAMQNLIDLHQNWILLASANALHCIFLLGLDLFEYELHSHIIQAMMSRISNIFSESFPFKKKDFSEYYFSIRGKYHNCFSYTNEIKWRPN